MPNPTMKVFDKNLRRVGTLIDSTDIQRSRRINSDYEITFLVPMTSDDFREKIAIKGHVQDERGQFYVIQSRSRSREGRKLTASIYCNHVMFKLEMDFDYGALSTQGVITGFGVSELGYQRNKNSLANYTINTLFKASYVEDLYDNNGFYNIVDDTVKTYDQLGYLGKNKGIDPDD
ncbi:hypothetical protein [Paenibacillus sp. TC-CSREp1]|uniref:hypothetical protein n=1 Tax=Paenibacillus sp. TC-CSREp1 TaxID=3410089 RepID=UPI003CFB18F1